MFFLSIIVLVLAHISSFNVHNPSSPQTLKKKVTETPLAHWVGDGSGNVSQDNSRNVFYTMQFFTSGLV